nr:SpoIIE family protein phosphatase [Pelomonas sp. P8]
MLLADGLGHGVDAAVAADTAIASLAETRTNSPAELLQRAHESMRHTRGAAAALVHCDADGLRFAGAGNICARLISGVQDRSLMSQHGTLGVQIRRLQDMRYDWPAHAILVLHSDGIVTRWTIDDAPGLLQCDPAVIAGWILRDHCRGRDDATVVVVKRRP